MKETSEFSRVFKVPLLLAAITTIGLVSALLAEGVWDAVSWFCLGTPLVLVGVLMARQRLTTGLGRDGNK
jgi:hypothetical protein